MDVEKAGVGQSAVWVTVSVEESPTWRLVERDLETSLELSPALALLGGKTQVATPARSLEVAVEPNTQSGKTLIVAEEGLRTPDCLPGDLLLRTTIRVPSSLSWRQQRVIKRFASLESAEADKLVTGVGHDGDHRLEVNVVEADKINNTKVMEDPVKPWDKTVTETIRDRLGIKRPSVRETKKYPYHFHRIFGL